MKRKLINHDVFENIQAKSLSKAERELLEAQPVLAKALQVEHLNLVCYGPEDVLYESNNGTYVHANYHFNESNLNFDKIEELVIDETSEQENSKKLLGQLLDAVLDGHEDKANELFSNYLNQPAYKRSLHESVCHTKKKTVAKKSSKKGAKLAFKSNSDKKMKLKEWSSLFNNIRKYSEMREYGPVLNESSIAHDDKGNVVGFRVPTMKARNEHKLLSFNWKTLDSDVKVLRGNAKNITENAEFCKTIAALKRNNALSDNDKIQESLEDIISRWPNVLYLTQDELSGAIGEALTMTGSTNYDDEMCNFMAEAILRTAHDTFVDRVSKILTLSGASVAETEEDPYEAFSAIVNNFYPHLDENCQLEMQMYVDLYDTLRKVHGMSRDELVKNETENHLRELASIIAQDVEPSLEVASAAADWLNALVETNLETADWDISNSVYTTITGEHPDMATKAKKGYTPSSDFSGDWGDPAPVSDGKSYKNKLADEMRSNSWGNIGGNDVYPSLQNPYAPKPFGDYKIKGEKHIDSDSDPLAHSGGADTWPSLQNPYAPKAETPSSYKAKADNLIVDK